MLNPFYFSSYVRPAIVKIKFVFIVLMRFFSILFKRNKQLTPLAFDYAKKYQFDQSLLVIRYRFKNALWYHFKGIKRTTKEGLIILNLLKVPEMPVVLVVYGLFRKSIFLIDVIPEATMQTSAFRTKINKPREVKYCTRPIVLCAEHNYPIIPKIMVKHSQINIRLSPISMKQESIQFEYPSFNQTEFL